MDKTPKYLMMRQDFRLRDESLKRVKMALLPLNMSPGEKDAGGGLKKNVTAVYSGFCVACSRESTAPRGVCQV